MPPIFIIGLPRSGSTLLSKLLNETPDILSINDLYYLQTVFALGASGNTVSKDQANLLVDWILKLSVERSSTVNSFVGQFSLDKEEILSIRGQVLNHHRVNPLNWALIMDEVLSKIAEKAGKKRWADKTPQNFMHLHLLYPSFPKAKFLFLFRDPRQVLASYKHVRGEGHDIRRYHPLFYAVYWRTAVRTYLASKNKEADIGIVLYEDIVKNTKETIGKLNRLLKTRIKVYDLNSIGNNTSFKYDKRRSITDTEKWLCQKICAREMKYLRYEIEPIKPSLKDFPELIYITIRFFLFQSEKILFSKDRRHRAISLIANFLGNKNAKKKYSSSD